MHIILSLGTIFKDRIYSSLRKYQYNENDFWFWFLISSKLWNNIDTHELEKFLVDNKTEIETSFYLYGYKRRPLNKGIYPEIKNVVWNIDNLQILTSMSNFTVHILLCTPLSEIYQDVLIFGGFLNISLIFFLIKGK